MASNIVTDEDVQKEVAAVEKLRQQLVDAEATRLERERSQTNAITLSQLQAERARLELEVTRAQNAAKAASVKDGVSAPLDAAKEAQAAAVAAAKEEARLAEADAQASTPAAASTTGEGS